MPKATAKPTPKPPTPQQPPAHRYDAQTPQCTVTIPGHFFPNGHDPEAYAMIGEGRCMEPLVPDGSMLICSPAMPLTAGALVAVWFDKAPPMFKRLVHPPLISLGASRNLESTVVECLEFEMLNPPSSLFIRADKIDRMHVVVGTLPPGSFEHRRSPAPVTGTAVQS
jgi:hypothetical protein